jgi:preprotein translocase subunit SecF
MDFVEKRRWFFMFSITLIIAGIVSISIPPSFKIGIEFTSGSAISIAYETVVEQPDVRNILTENGYHDAIIQKTSGNGFFIRTRTLDSNDITSSERKNLEDKLSSLGNLNAFDVSTVSPIVAQETVRNAGIAVFVASIAILIYITWAFRLVPNPLRMGTVAIIAAIHDVLLVLGFFSLAGRFINLEINAMFITGILTVVGYSVHDTIVVFDRIRENFIKNPSRSLEIIVNTSISETLGRSLTTSFTTVIVIAAMLLMGGQTIQSLLYTLLIGIIAGTYSSLWIASQMLVVWENKEWLRLFKSSKI